MRRRATRSDRDRPWVERLGAPAISRPDGFVAIATLLVVFSLVATPTPVLAADAKADHSARQHFKQGEAYYANGQFAEALAAYQSGYKAVPLAGFLVNIAQCHRRRGDLKLARATYEKFVLVAPDSPLVSEVRGLIAELDKLIVETETPIAQPAKTGLLQDPAPIVSGPVTATGDEVAPLGPGTPVVERRRATRVLLAAPDPAASANVRARAILTTSPYERRSIATPTHERWWLWPTVTVAAAVAIGGIATAVAVYEPNPGTIHDGTLGTLRR